MDDLIAKNKFQSSTSLILIELVVLLLLPLPFLKLNVLYVVSALIIMFLSKYMRKEKWSDYGFKTINPKLLLLAVSIGIVYGFIDNMFIEQLITKLTGTTPDLGSYESVKGDTGRFIIMLAIGWFVGGLFEELFFRGYLYNRFQSLIHNQSLFKISTILLTSIVFAFAHNYQGISGILDTGLFAVIMGVLYFVLGRNVWYLIIIHGFYDTVGIVRLYLGY